MPSDSSGYDQQVSQFSPEGRIFQIEYAKKALSKSGTIIGLRGKDCVVLAAEKIPSTKLHESSSVERIFSVDARIGLALVGYVPDGHHLLQVSRSESTTYKLHYDDDIPLEQLKLRIAMYMNSYTRYGSFRPFGAGLIMASCQSGPELFCVEPCGTAYSYFGCAMGKNETAAKTEIGNLDLKNMSARKLVKEVAKILYMVHDERDDNLFELELSWIGKHTQGRHEKVPVKIVRKVEAHARAYVEERDFKEV